MKKRLIRIAVGAAIFVVALLLPEDASALFAGAPSWLRPVAFLAAYAVVGYKVIWKAVRGLFNGQVMDENFLMSVASIGAFALREFPEAVAVMLFYQIGEAFEDFAVGKSRRSITQLMDISPDVANLRTAEGIEEVDPASVKPGDVIVVKPGEKVPLDGKVLEGRSALNTSALTGESLPRDVGEGDEVLSGCVNTGGLLTVEVTKPFGESTVSKILDMVENASSKKARTESFITRFAVIYTPIVVGAAVLLAVIPPLVVPGAHWSDWIYRALNFLVVSCPCALVISVPLSFFGGIGGASKSGVLIKGSNYLELLSKAEVVVMDKTGTLTEGSFSVEEISPTPGFSADDVLRYAALTEAFSDHPISLSLKAAYGKEIDETEVHDVFEVAGEGVKATVGEDSTAVGNARLMAGMAGFTDEAGEHAGGTKVFVAVNGVFAGSVSLADKIKEDSAEAVAALKKMGIKTVMLTGDNDETGRKVGEQLGIDEIHTQLLPGDKVDVVEEIFAKKSPKGKVVFVGDGINDAPVLTRADVGVAMGALGSDAAIEAADMVIMNDSPIKLTQMMKLSARTMRIVYENIVFALGVKVLVLVLAALGLVGLWAAVFADVGVSVLAICNALRCLRPVK